MQMYSWAWGPSLLEPVSPWCLFSGKRACCIIIESTPVAGAAVLSLLGKPCGKYLRALCMQDREAGWFQSLHGTPKSTGVQSCSRFSTKSDVEAIVLDIATLQRTDVLHHVCRVARGKHGSSPCEGADILEVVKWSMNLSDWEGREAEATSEDRGDVGVSGSRSGDQSGWLPQACEVSEGSHIASANGFL